ncbi:MAG: hypothetical protein IPM85_10585 [Chitinophagaceae bacterium]|nr:hypothetical protein [Chitinophagaceae bacterium]
MFNIKRKFLSTFLLPGFLILLFTNVLNAQTATVSISMEEAIDTALANNREISLAQLDEKIAAARLKETNAIFSSTG